MRFLLHFFLLLMLGACIEPFSLDGSKNNRLLVVNGRITDQPGPYTVELYYTQPIDRLVASERATGATVTITDDNDVSEKLLEKSDGVYSTQSITGVVGRTYKLRIELADGDLYESAAETMEPVGSFSNQRFEFVPGAFDSDPGSFNIFLDSKFAPEQEGRALWRWSGVFQFRTNPEDHGYYIGTKTFVPDPPPCSGFIRDGFSIRQVGGCTCCLCYHTVHNTKPVISDTRLAVTGEVKNVPIGFLEAGDVYFEKKVWLTIEQESVSPAVYNFWSQVIASSNKGSDLFQTPPPATRGNINSLTENSIGVIGVFSASAVKSDSLVIHRTDVLREITGPSTFTDDCRLYYYTETTLTRPSYYR